MTLKTGRIDILSVTPDARIAKSRICLDKGVGIALEVCIPHAPAPLSNRSLSNALRFLTKQSRRHKRFPRRASNPQLMTTNNTKAKLSVGQNVPYKAGSSTAGGGVVDTIKREDVEMTPHVNLGGLVRLEIELNIKELLPNSASLEPTWTTRKIENTVVVADQESIAIGGLASTKESVTKSKVPLLGDIPILGALFRSSRTSKTKSNLLVLLTPYVLSNAAEARRLTRRKLHERDNFLHSFKSLHDRRFQKNIDYGKRRGLLAEMSKQVQASDAQAKALEELMEQEQLPVDGPLLEARPVEL